ncbi:MAG TPA: ABC transporter permease [Longimicrobiales bacterium]|nr:ABC transporter permease [Longimicrobiales bacterium]
MTRIARDFRYALRQARRAPGFAAIAVAVLAVGIGAATAIYSVVDHVLLRPLDLPDSDRLVTVCEKHGAETRHCSVSTVNLSDWADRATSFEALGAARWWSTALRTGSGARFVPSGIATPGFFRALGVPPARGRLLVDDDLPAVPGGAAVVTHEFWQTELGGREDVVGATLVLDEIPRTVVGVLPAGFQAPRLEGIGVWLPLHFDPRAEERRDWRGFVGVGRLRRGVGVEQAGEELQRVQAGLAESHPDALVGWSVTTQRMRDHIVAPIRPVLRLFLAAVAVLLVIVCVNIANLLLARATAREREMAVRLALGAGHGGLTRLLLVEAGALAAAGCLGGIALAYAGTELFIALAPPGVPRLEEVRVDGRVLAFAAAVTALAALLFGLAPASRAWALDLAASFRGGRSGGTRGTARVRRGLVVVQLGLALALVFGAGLLTRSFSSLLQWRPGFEVERLLTFSLFLSPGSYPTTAEVRAFLERAEAELGGLAGVESVGTVSAGPLFGGGDGLTPFLVRGRPPVPVGEAPTVAWFDAGPGYVPTLGLPLLEGRNFDGRDRAGSTPVALVNRAMATRHWPEGSPVGARVQLPELEGEVEIIGVIPDVPPFSPGVAPQPEIYFSNRQQPRWGTFVVLRTRSDPGAVVRPVEAALAAIDPDVSPSSVRTMRDHVAAQLVRPRFNLALVAILAAVALVLGAAGLFGVVAYMVALRRHEIGVRIALGADRAAVVRWVLGDGLRLLVGGLALGAATSILFGRLVTDLAVGVEPTDPATILGTVIILAGVVFAASLPPALRAAGVAPAEALRAE